MLIYLGYQKDFTPLTSSPKKGRMNTISKEVATLTTSLPTGIFLKIAESRSDVMKVLIVGSEGSPYAGGQFM
jgi:ubiquitin-protein ligase